MFDFEVWQIVLLAVGGGIWVLFAVLDFKNRIAAKKRAKEKAQQKNNA